MGVCHHYRIPHSELLSWSADDRDKAIWMWLRERQTCSRCGTRPDEWNPEQGGHRRAYTAETVICRGCQAIAGRDAGVTDEERSAGVQVVLKKRGS